MSKMTIELPDKEYKKIKDSALELGISIKDYVLDALKLKQTIMIRDDGVVRVLKRSTVKALEESRKNFDKLPRYNSIDELMKDLKR